MLSLAYIVAALPPGVDKTPDVVDKPDPGLGGLPGISTAESLIDGMAKYALLAALVGLLISAGMWAIGAHSQNFSQTYNGKKGCAISIGAALVIGVSAFLVNWFYGAGSGIQG